MKKLHFLILLINVFFTTANAQSPVLEWTHTIGGPSSDFTKAVAVDKQGNVYSTGSFKGIVDFDPGAAVYNLNTNPSYNYDWDIFILKLDAAGNFVWAKRMGSTESDYGIALALDAAGNVYTTGSFRFTVDFDPGIPVFNLTSASGNNVFISKLDPAGNFVWAKSMAGSLGSGNSIVIEPITGNVYSAGNFGFTTDFDPGIGVFNLTGSGSFISKLNSAGNFIWAKKLGGSANKVAIDLAGKVYTSGTFKGVADFDPGAAVLNFTSVNNSYFDLFIAKLDSSGNLRWAKHIGGANGVNGNSFILDKTGSIYHTGSFEGGIDFDPGVGWEYLVSIPVNRIDIFISKMDSAGNFVWAKRIGAGQSDEAISIAIDTLANIYTTGTYQTTVDFNPGTGVANLFGEDVFALKLDSAGNFKWAKQLGFAYGESSSIIVDTAANVYIGGRTSSGDLYVYKMSQPAGLPVVLVAFEAVNKGTDAYLWWKTTNEFNNDKFVIERSLDGTAFSEIGEVKADQNATTTSNYSFLDINARTKFPGINLFYRFRQVDRDGRFTHSPVRSVKFNSSAPSIQIFPNPAKDVMTIKQDDFQPGLSFLLTNQSGITMMTSVLKNQTTTVNINHLSAGVYYVQIVGSNQKPIKVIKK